MIGGALAAAGLAYPTIALPQERLTLDSALRETLKQNPHTLLQQQAVRSSQGGVLQAQGQFDPVINGSITRNREMRLLRQDEKNAIPTTPNAQISNNISYNVGVQQTLPSGVTVGAGASVATLYDNVSAINGIPPQTAGRISLNMLVPLLRNAGRAATTARLSAADEELSAARFDLVFAYAAALQNTAFAYWDYLARWRRLEIAREAEQRSARLVDETRKLIGADQIPKAEIQLVLASLAERAAARIAAEQSLEEGRRNLAVQIGLPPERWAGLPVPVDEFPGFDGPPLELDKHIAPLRTLAIERRADLEAAKLRERAARYRLVAAQSGLRPQLDFGVDVGYGSLVEARVPFDLGQVLASQRVGPSIAARLSVQLPVRNSAAEGAFIVQSAALDSSTIRLRSLADTIGNNVSLGTLGLVHSTRQLVQAIEATRYYRQSLENERTKRRQGLSTLIAVLSVEDRLTNALLVEVQARQNYATAIAQLRFELGTIVLQRGEQFDVEVSDLFSPRFDVPR